MSAALVPAPAARRLQAVLGQLTPAATAEEKKKCVARGARRARSGGQRGP
jgi:hypothetical protein